MIHTVMKYGLRSCLLLALIALSNVTCVAGGVASDGVANANEDVLPGEMRVGQATKLCEKLIAAECLNVHALKYCAVMKKMSPACKKIKPNDDDNVVIAKQNEKIFQDLCKLKTDGSDRELQAQLKAQLMACIAAKRDPNARKTGRPEYACPTKTPIPWCSINSPSWRETILYPDPEKLAKKKRYADELTDLNTKIDEAKKAKLDHSDLDQQLKDLVLEKSLGQAAEEKIETDICSGEQVPAECREGATVSVAPVKEKEITEIVS